MCSYSIMKRKKGFMSWDTFKIIIDKLAKIDTIESIQLHGHGESFIHKDIEKFANYAKSMCPGKSLSLFTNGVLVTKIPEGFNYIVVSFNGGTKEAYEKVMGLNFENAVKKIREITPCKKVVLQMLLGKDNIGTVEAFKTLWEGWEYGMHDGFYNWGGKIPYNGLRPAPSENGVCLRLFIHMSIHWDGMVNLCTQDYEQEVPVGSAVENSIVDLYNSPIFIEKRKEQKERIWSGICKECSFRKYECLKGESYGFTS